MSRGRIGRPKRLRTELDYRKVPETYRLPLAWRRFAQGSQTSPLAGGNQPRLPHEDAGPAGGAVYRRLERAARVAYSAGGSFKTGDVAGRAATLPPSI